MKEQWSKQKVIDRKWQTEAKLNEEKRERCTVDKVNPG